MYDRIEYLEEQLAEARAEERAWEQLERRQDRLHESGNPQGLCPECCGDGEYPDGRTCHFCKGTGQDQ